jgi:hypothetical protein
MGIIVAVEIYQQPIGDVEGAGYPEARDEESDFGAREMRSEMHGPAEEEESYDAGYVAWDDDLEAYALDGEGGEILLFSFCDGYVEFGGWEG